MFIYHAGQRHGSLNFYFGVLAAFVAGFVALFTADKLWALSQPVAPVIATVLGFAAILITILFGLLDMRNADLVKCDEKLVARIEKAYRPNEAVRFLNLKPLRRAITLERNYSGTSGL